MGDKLIDQSEVLFRQIHPTFYEKGEPSSQPFKPTEKDDNRLSVDRSALTTAADSCDLYRANGHASVAVYGLTVGEFTTEKINCHSDPLKASDTQLANPAHAFANYADFGSSSQKNIAKRLKRMAIARGCLHPLSKS